MHNAQRKCMYGINPNGFSFFFVVGVTQKSILYGNLFICLFLTLSRTLSRQLVSLNEISFSLFVFGFCFWNTFVLLIKVDRFREYMSMSRNHLCLLKNCATFSLCHFNSVYSFWWTSNYLPHIEPIPKYFLVDMVKLLKTIPIHLSHLKNKSKTNWPTFFFLLRREQSPRKKRQSR